MKSLKMGRLWGDFGNEIDVLSSGCFCGIFEYFSGGMEKYRSRKYSFVLNNIQKWSDYYKQ